MVKVKIHQSHFCSLLNPQRGKKFGQHNSFTDNSTLEDRIKEGSTTNLVTRFLKQHHMGIQLWIWWCEINTNNEPRLTWRGVWPKTSLSFLALNGCVSGRPACSTREFRTSAWYPIEEQRLEFRHVLAKYNCAAFAIQLEERESSY